MTDAQRERLPALMREIVDADREIEAMACSPLVTLLAYADHRKRRGELRQAADAQWGHRLCGDKTN